MTKKPTKYYLICESCGSRVEDLTEEQALADLTPHGWTNWQTANHVKCFDCFSENDEYETYYAGRITSEEPGKVFQKLPDIFFGDSDVECWSQSVKEYNKIEER